MCNMNKFEIIQGLVVVLSKTNVRYCNMDVSWHHVYYMTLSKASGAYPSIMGSKTAFIATTHVIPSTDNLCVLVAATFVYSLWRNFEIEWPILCFLFISNILHLRESCPVWNHYIWDVWLNWIIHMYSTGVSNWMCRICMWTATFVTSEWNVIYPEAHKWAYACI